MYTVWLGIYHENEEICEIFTIIFREELVLH